MAQRQIDRSRNLLPYRRDGADPLLDELDRINGRQEAVGERLIFSEESEEEMFGIDAVGAELAGFVAGEKDDATGFSV